MKFLIAASLVCLALIGQTQGGSLRGYTYSVPVPHQTYGAPLTGNEILREESKPIVEDAIIVKKPIVPLSASIVVPEIQIVPHVDSLPLVDSVVHFGIPSEPQPSPVTPSVVVSTTPQPELPYLQPGLPVLPERPVVPLVVKEKELVPEVNNAYLPPAEDISGIPSVVYGPPTVPEAEVIENAGFPADHATPIIPVTNVSHPSDVYGPPTVAREILDVPSVPQIAEIPALPEAPVTPSVPVAPQPSETYGPPAIPSEVYGVPPVAEVYEVPVTVAPEPSAVYGPPTVAYEAPSVPKIAEIPALPAAPVTPFIPVTATPTPSSVYGPPAVAGEVHSVQQIVDIPTLSVAPVVPSTPIPATPLSVPTATTHTFSIRPIVSQIINFASSILPIGLDPYADSGPVEVPGVFTPPAEVPTKSGYHYTKPTLGFPTPVQNIVTSEIGSASAPVIVPEVVAAPAETPIKSGYQYQKPVKGFPTPVSVGLVSHVQNSASSLSSSSIQVNHVVVPGAVKPSGVAHAQQVKPSGFTIQSVFENSKDTSTGNFNQVSFVNHALPSLSPITGFVGVGVPHSVFAVPSF